MFLPFVCYLLGDQKKVAPGVLFPNATHGQKQR